MTLWEIFNECPVIVPSLARSTSVAPGEKDALDSPDRPRREGVHRRRPELVLPDLDLSRGLQPLKVAEAGATDDTHLSLSKSYPA